MASEYYKKKFQDVKKDEVVELTKKEKFCNWWHYHWGHVLIAILTVVCIILVLNQFVFVTRSDYKVIIVSQFAGNMDEDIIADELAKFGEDVNGDGKVVVKVRSFLANFDLPADEELVALTGDIGVGNSQIFILDDFDGFNEKYGIISEGDYYTWSDCPELAALNLDLDSYTVAIRSYDYEKYAKENAHADGLWDAMTAGAK